MSVSGGTPVFIRITWSGRRHDAGSGESDVAGTYTVTVTDANSCTKTTVGVTSSPSQHPGRSITLTNRSHEFYVRQRESAGSIDLTVNGRHGRLTDLQLEPGRCNPQRKTARSVWLTAGTYTVTVTDANGCTKTTSVDHYSHTNGH